MNDRKTHSGEISRQNTGEAIGEFIPTPSNSGNAYEADVILTQLFDQVICGFLHAIGLKGLHRQPCHTCLPATLERPINAMFILTLFEMVW
ncbi:MAG: hypothetical protein IPJ47_11385 [Anaerolineales bacterium]|nr:hypothetical protein [Anaerolineales bacterium]